MRRLMAALGRVRQRVASYAGHPDPLAQRGNIIALVVASDQPFYPLSVMVAAGWWGWPSIAALLALPLFVAVPAVMRRSTVLGRMVLVLAAIINTLAMSWALGRDSGVELLLIPTGMLGVLLSRQRERWLMLLLTGATAVAYFLAQKLFTGSLAHLDPLAAHALLRLHAGMVATLTIFFGLLFPARDRV